MSETALLEETQAFYRHAEERARTCELRCPEEGGACAEQILCIDPGQEPWWDAQAQRMTTRPCERWKEYNIRQLLVEAGVDQRSAGLKLGDLDEPSDAKAVIDFVAKAMQGGGDGWLVVTATARVGKIMSVGVLRNVRKHTDRPVWYLNCEVLRRSLKEFYADPEHEDDPLDRARRYPLVTFDALNPSRQPEWMRAAIEEALHTRWSNRLPTLIVTQSKIDDLARSYPLVDDAWEEAAVSEASA